MSALHHFQRAYLSILHILITLVVTSALSKNMRADHMPLEDIGWSLHCIVEK